MRRVVDDVVVARSFSRPLAFRCYGRGFLAAVFAAAASVAFTAAAAAQTDPCVVEDDGSGTVVLPPEGCPYLSPDEFHAILDGLPPTVTIEMSALHRDFICKRSGTPQEFCNNPGGGLGGEQEFFQSTLELTLDSTDPAALPLRRVLLLPVMCQVDTGPRTLGDAVQSFPTEMVQLQGTLPAGDPDFDSLSIVGGSMFGLPSPGQTTLTQLPSGNWQVDSFFDVVYKIDYVGSPTGALAGMSGSTTGTLRMEAGGEPESNKCDPATDGGPHWLDNTVETVDYIPTEARVGIDLSLDGAVDTDLTLRGPTRVRRGPPDTAGATHTVQTEILSMDLSSGGGGGGGVTLAAGAGLGSQGSLPPSPGMLTEQADSFQVDSFFDVFIEITLDDGTTLYNQQPLRVEAVAECVPPQLVFTNPQPVDLWSAPFGGALVARLITIQHETFPPPPPPDPHKTVDPTVVRFSNTGDVPAIPANFFGPGTDPFTGDVILKGGGVYADTLIQRAGPLAFPGAGFPRPSNPIETEIVELELVSVSPITVVGPQPGGGDWDVRVDLSSVTPAPGQLDAQLDHANGGTFDTVLAVQPRFTFTKVGDPTNVLVLDSGLDSQPPLQIQLQGPFVINLDPSLAGQVDAPNDGDFVPGVDQPDPTDPTSQQVVQVTGNSLGGGVTHTIVPPPPPPPPDDHITIDPTVIRLGSAGGGDIPAIPADFFDPGSQPFDGEVALQAASSGPPVSLQRGDDPVRPTDPPPTQGTVAIELVALSLVSVDPITVDYGGGTVEQWNLAVSNIGSSGEDGVGPGTLTATKVHENGGTYSASFELCPVLTFTRQGDGAVRVLDLCPTPGALPLDLNIIGVFVHVVDPSLGVIVPVGALWVPGIEDVGGIQAIVPSTASTNDTPPSVEHTVQPPVDFCPTATPGDPFDPCFPLQQRDCAGSPTDACLPQVVRVDFSGGQMVAEVCDCYTPGPGCGPAQISVDNDTVSCVGQCVSPDQPPCELWIVGGGSTGLTSAGVLDFPDGTLLTCQCTSGCTVPADCADGNPCTDDVCNADGTCSNPNTAAGTDCDDGVFCNGPEACDGNGNCVSGPPPNCDDGNPCTDDACDALTDQCVNTPVPGRDCDDGVFCNGPDTCDDTGNCVSGPPPTCDDGDICTDDLCDLVNDVCTNPDNGLCDTCGPTPDGTACLPATCPEPPTGDVCQPKCVVHNKATGVTTVTDCACTGPDDCHVDLGPTPGGRLPGDDPCIVVDNGSGTVTLPPSGCEYLSADEVHMIIDGLPADTQIELAPIHKQFICERDNPVCSPLVDPNECEQPGGTLGGNTDCTYTRLEMAMTVVGPSLPGLVDRTLVFDPAFMEVHTGPRTPGDPVQDFPTEIFRLQGSLFGDPDFCTLTITAGSDFGLPSPGRTTLTQLPGGSFAVDSFFDLTYRIDFVGCPAPSPLAGMSGSTTGTIRMGTGSMPTCTGGCAAGEVCNESVTDLGGGNFQVCCDCVAAGCTTPADCDDGNPCTDDICNVDGTCSNPPVADNTPCPDGVFCNGDEVCQGGVCQSGTPPTCDDGDICTDDLCDLVNDVCTNPDNGLCDTCGPTPDGTACLPMNCPVPPDNDVCQPKCVVHNAATGVTSVTDCSCTGPNDCHVDLGSAAGGGRVPGGDPCIIPDNGSGTVTLPPLGCDYLTMEQIHEIIGNLPPNTKIELAAIHTPLACGQGAGADPPAWCPPIGLCEDDGGDLGGKTDCFDSELVLSIDIKEIDTGNVLVHEDLTMSGVQSAVFTALRTEGDPVQSFDTKMFHLQGSGGGGASVFQSLQIIAGDNNGLPSPGHTTLRQLPGGNWSVDSFFDITFQIDFVGAPGSILEGFGGTEVGTVRMGTGSMPACTGGCPVGEVCNESVTDLGNGDFQICCDCVAEATGACCVPNDPFCLVTTEADCAGQGTYLGDGTACAGSVEACCSGSGGCADDDNVCCAAIGGTPQGAGTDCLSTDCPLPTCEPSADGTACEPDACSPIPEDRCLATCVNIDPLTGAVTILDCDCMNGFDPMDCHVDLPGAGGRTLRDPTSPCVVADNGGGTVTLPPDGCEYLSPDEVHMIIDGLPADTHIELAPIHKQFICNRDSQSCSQPVIDVDCEESGGSLGGSLDCNDTTLEMAMTVVGPSLPGLPDRTLVLDPVFMEVHTGPRNPGDPVQSFPTEIFRLQGSLGADPDFCQLTITAGSDFGLPSPGHTTLTQLPGGGWAVDSFFDLTYKIDFVGCPGTPLDGMSGSTTGTIRMQTGTAPGCAGQCAPGTRCKETRKPQADGTIDYCCKCVPVRPKVADELAVPSAASWPPSARATTCMSDADCSQEAVCIPDETGALPGTCYVPKNRYLAVAGDTSVTTSTARRLSVVLTQRWCNGAVGGTACTRDDQCGPAMCSDVPISCTMDAQCNAVALGSVCSSTSVCVQRLGWFGPPDAKGYASIVDEANRHYTTWGSEQFPIDCGVNAMCPANAYCDTGLGGSITCKWNADDTEVKWTFVFLGDCRISPMIRDVVAPAQGGLGENKAAREYLVESVFLGDDVADETSYSAPLRLPTVRVWGDLVGGSSGGIATPPDGLAGFTDVLHQVFRFKDTGQAHLSWLDLHDQGTNQLVGFQDMLDTVNGFKDKPYPYDDPCTCASVTPCP